MNKILLNLGESRIVLRDGKYYLIRRELDGNTSIIPSDSLGVPLPNYAYPIYNKFGRCVAFNYENTSTKPITMTDDISLN